LVVVAADTAAVLVGSNSAGQTVAVLVAAAVRLALVLVVEAVAVGAVAVVVAAAYVAAVHLDALLVRTFVARLTCRLALAGRGVAGFVVRAVIIAGADAAAALARESAAILLSLAWRHALAFTQLAVSAGAVTVAVAAADTGAVDLDALLVGATVVRLARRLALAGRGVAGVAVRAVAVAAADASPVAVGADHAGQLAAALLVAMWLALAQVPVAVAVVALLVSVTAAYLGPVDLDASLAGAVVGGLARRLALAGRGVACQAVTVLIAAARRHALVLGQGAGAVGAVLVLAATADLAALHLDAFLVRTVVARFADRLALASRVVAERVSRAVVVAAADAAAVLAREIAAVVPAVALRHALALTPLAVAAGAVAVSVAATYFGVVDLDALLVGALGS
jgi:hypothetical protein